MHAHRDSTSASSAASYSRAAIAPGFPKTIWLQYVAAYWFIVFPPILQRALVGMKIYIITLVNKNSHNVGLKKSHVFPANVFIFWALLYHMTDVSGLSDYIKFRFLNNN